MIPYDAKTSVSRVKCIFRVFYASTMAMGITGGLSKSETLFQHFEKLMWCGARGVCVGGDGVSPPFSAESQLFLEQE